MVSQQTSDRPDPGGVVSGGKSEPDTQEWQGEYIDVTGQRGRVNMMLRQDGDRLGGTYELVMRTEDEPEVVTGEVAGTIEGNKVKAVFTVGKEKVHYEAEIKPAGSYAKQAMVGLVQTAPGADFGGGVWIAWNFVSRPGRG